MKKIRIASMLILVMFLLSSLAVFAYDESDLTTYLYGENAEVGKIIAKNSTPNLDANISAGEGWSDAKHLDYTNMPTFWGSSSRCIITADLYFAWDANGLYVASSITDPTMVKTTGEDIESPEYGWDGDVFVFGIDPLGACFDSGMTMNGERTAWYCIGVGEGNALRVYRSNANDGEITDSCKGAASVSATGWTFEILLPWDLIIDDTMIVSMGDVQLTADEITVAGAISNAGVIYMDRAILSDEVSIFMSRDSEAVNGDLVTLSRNITVPLVHEDGQGWNSGGESLRSYGISLAIGDAAGIAPETEAPVVEDTTPAETDPEPADTEEEPAEDTTEPVEEEEDETTTKPVEEPVEDEEKGGAPIGLIIGIVAAVVVIAAVVVVIIIKKKK